jgi:hypothetical protein
MRARFVLSYSTRRRIHLLAAEVDVFRFSAAQRAVLEQLIDLVDELDGEADHEEDCRQFPAAGADHDFLCATFGIAAYAPASPERVLEALIATRDALEEAGAGFSATLGIDRIIAGGVTYGDEEAAAIIDGMSLLLESMAGDVARSAALVAAVYLKAR